MQQDCQSWFGSSYYDLLYRHRDKKEARVFLDNLLAYLSLPPDTHILDAACGKGRHALYLAGRGYHVTGIDLSEENIRHASLAGGGTAEFRLHDMRSPVDPGRYNLILNLFTSFGYYTDEENKAIFRNFYDGLRPGGIMVLDFINMRKALATLVPREDITAGGARFVINRKQENGYLVKEIAVTDGSRHFNFTERVCILHAGDFRNYCRDVNFKILNLSGDYGLNTYDERQSDRLILVAQKTHGDPPAS